MVTLSTRAHPLAATIAFAVEPKRWCFPFVGCVGYRGFFDREDAEKFAAGLAREGLDTYSGGSTAYSTLGYFADPVLSTMVGGGDQYVASLLFHELTHQKLYVKDGTPLAEAKCNGCHGKNAQGKDDKKVRNEFGKAVAKYLKKGDFTTQSWRFLVTIFIDTRWSFSAWFLSSCLPCRWNRRLSSHVSTNIRTLNSAR